MNIVAYGSLLNQESLEKTLQRPTQLTKITIPGVQRIFNAPFGEYSFLNLITSQGADIEAAYFELNQNEVAKFSQREKGSEIIEVLGGMYAFVWPKTYCQELPVLQSYIEVCETGCREVGIDLWRGTKIPAVIVNDLDQPLYP